MSGKYFLKLYSKIYKTQKQKTFSQVSCNWRRHNSWTWLRWNTRVFKNWYPVTRHLYPTHVLYRQHRLSSSRIALNVQVVRKRMLKVDTCSPMGTPLSYEFWGRYFSVIDHQDTFKGFRFQRGRGMVHYHNSSKANILINALSSVACSNFLRDQRLPFCNN